MKRASRIRFVVRFSSDIASLEVRPFSHLSGQSNVQFLKIDRFIDHLLTRNRASRFFHDRMPESQTKSSTSRS